MNQERLEKWLLVLGGGAVAIVALTLFLLFGPGSPHAEQQAAEAKRTEREYREHEQQLIDERLRKEDEARLGVPRFHLLSVKENRPVEWGVYRIAIRTEGVQAGHHRSWVVNADSLPPGLFIPTKLSRMNLVIEVQNTSDKPVPFPFAESGRPDWDTKEPVVWSPIRGVGFSNTGILASIKSPRFTDRRSADQVTEAGPAEAALPDKPAVVPNPDQMIAPGHFASTVIEQPLSPEPLAIVWYLRFRPGISTEHDGLAIQTNPIDHGFEQYELNLLDADGIPLTP
ncbi:MAG: hypothetical protein U0996_05285 [Planctomycetaceae bacterium]